MSEIVFAGSIALVMAAETELGRAYARGLAQAGALVVLAGAEREAGMTLMETLRSEGLGVHFEPYETLAGEEAAALVGRTVERFGRLDILVNNPTDPKDGAQGDRQLGLVVAEQVEPAQTMLKATLPVMRAQRFGRIVNCTSGAGAFGTGQNTAARAAASSLFAVTILAALDNLDMDVRINAVAPLIASCLSPADLAKLPLLDVQVFSAAEVAPLVTYLASAACSVTGGTFASGGGRHASLWTATTPGFFMPGAAAADIAQRFGDVVGRQNPLAPVTFLDEIALVAV